MGSSPTNFFSFSSTKHDLENAYPHCLTFFFFFFTTHRVILLRIQTLNRSQQLDVSRCGKDWKKNGVLRLTNHTHFLQGHAFYSSPFRFKNSTDGRAFSFSTTFVFGIVPDLISGGGFAFTITPSKNLKASSGQHLGMLNAADLGNLSNHLVGIEFDTVQNLEFKDIDDNHVGIDINSLVSKLGLIMIQSTTLSM